MSIMAPIDLNIVYDQSEGPYTPGQLVTGKVRFYFDTSKPVLKIKIKFEGKADVAWRESEKDGDDDRTVWRTSHEQYFKSKLILYERPGDFNLSRGDHVYPFGVLLPTNIPSSFTGVHGKIQYFAIAKLQISGQFNKTKKEFFNVKNFLNLNYFPILKTPAEEKKSKKFYMLCCFPCGEVSGSVCIPQSGFVSNETIPLILEINNESSVSLRKITAKVVEKIEWRADSRRTSSKKVLKSFRLGSVRSNSSATIVENVQVPEKDYLYLENCHIIFLKHELWIEADPGFGHCDLDIYLPITIGDIGFNPDEPNSHEDDPIPPFLDKDDYQLSEFEFEKYVKLEVPTAQKPPDTKSAEIFTSYEKY